MTTEEIIADLRQNGLTSASIYTKMERAANRLEELQRANKNTLADLAVAIEQRDDAIASAHPEPSRLEIAAMAMQAFICSSAFIIDIPRNSLEYADALIAAAKETK